MSVGGIALKADPPGLPIRLGAEVRVTPEAVTEARVSAHRDIDPHVACAKPGDRA
jgi:hypothetical protein